MLQILVATEAGNLPVVKVEDPKKVAISSTCPGFFYRKTGMASSFSSFSDHHQSLTAHS